MDTKENETSQTPKEISGGAEVTQEGKSNPVPLTHEWVLQQIDDAKNEVLKNTKTEIDKQVQTDKSSLITVFGIFASIISFLTIEFQFLRSIDSLWQILGFTMILFALLFSFNIGLDYLVKSRLEKETPKPNIFFSAFVIILLVVGIVFSWIGGGMLSQQKYLKYSEELNNKTNALENKYDQSIKLIYQKFQKLNDRIEAKK